jgi:hypothetical protein
MVRQVSDNVAATEAAAIAAEGEAKRPRTAAKVSQ